MPAQEGDSGAATDATVHEPQQQQQRTALHTTTTPSPLHRAVYNGNAHRVQELIDPCCGINDQIVGGHTPLHTAVRLSGAPSERLTIIRKLIQHGADISKEDDFGNNALHYAAPEQQEEVLSAILSSTLPGPALDKTLGASNRAGCTPLALAVQAGNIGVVKILIGLPGSATGAAADNRGATALHHAAELTPYDDATAEGMSFEIAKLLLAHTDIDVAACTNDGDATALHYAASKGGEALVKLLVETAGTGADEKNRDGYTPLELAKLSNARATLSSEQLRFAGFPGHTANRYAVIRALEPPPVPGGGGAARQ